MHNLQVQPVYSFRFNVPEIGDLSVDISKSVTTNDLLRWLSNFLAVPKKKIKLIARHRDVTHEELNELGGKV